MSQYFFFVRLSQILIHLNTKTHICGICQYYLEGKVSGLCLTRKQRHFLTPLCCNNFIIIVDLVNKEERRIHAPMCM